MGIPVVTVGSKHTCPMSDGVKPHVGGVVTSGVPGVTINGIPVAVKGSQCVCASPQPNAIAMGCPGVLVDGEQIAIVGSLTQHGGVVIDGVPGVTISGGFPVQPSKADSTQQAGKETTKQASQAPAQPEDEEYRQPGNDEKPEPRIFNLQWRKDDKIVKYEDIQKKVFVSADTVGYDDGEEVSIEIYQQGYDEPVDILTGVVKDGRVEIEWEIEPEEEDL